MPPLQREDSCYDLPAPPHKDIFGRNNSIHTCTTADETEISDDTSSELDETRRVRFAVAVKKYFIERHNTFSQDEISRYWYSKEEAAKTRSKIEKIADRMEAGKLEKKSSPYRGLDRWTGQGAVELEQVVYRLYDAVLDEQDLQWDEKINDKKRLAKISRKVSAASLKKAVDAGQKDELAAAKIYKTSSFDGLIFADDDSSVGSMASTASYAARRKKRRSGRKKSSQQRQQRRKRRKGSRKNSRKDPPANQH